MTSKPKNPKKQKQIFIGATRQNDGKTMVSVGLFNAFKERFNKLAYLKPVGQQYKLIENKKIDKDAVLFKSVYNLPHNLELMSPVAVPSGFTENYINNPNKNELINAIQASHDELSSQSECLLIEGTGHAGVGSVIDLSNGDVAHLLGAKVILVCLGGIGSSIDEVMLNKACIEQAGAELGGVIINKVIPEKFDKVNNSVRKGLEQKGVNVLGVLPFETILTKFTINDLVTKLNAELISGEPNCTNSVDRILVGAMLPHDAIDYFTKNTLVIVPANREGLVMTAMFANLLGSDKIEFNISGIIFTGGIHPHEKILNLMKHTDIPMLLVEEDSYLIATKINKMMVKLNPNEGTKIIKIQEMIKSYVDLDQVCELL